MLSLIIIFAMNIVTPIYVQAMGASAMSASMILFPAILLSCVIAPLAGRYYDKHGAKVLLPAGFALIGLFCIALAFAKDLNALWVLALLYIPVICGSALIIGPIQSFALSRLSFELNPHGVTVMSTGFQIAGCVGSSIFTGVYGLILSNRMAVNHDALVASGTGFFVVSILAAICAFIGFIISLTLKKYENEKNAIIVFQEALR